MYNVATYIATLYVVRNMLISFFFLCINLKYTIKKLTQLLLWVREWEGYGPSKPTANTADSDLFLQKQMVISQQKSHEVCRRTRNVHERPVGLQIIVRASIK